MDCSVNVYVLNLLETVNEVGFTAKDPNCFHAEDVLLNVRRQSTKDQLHIPEEWHGFQPQASGKIEDKWHCDHGNQRHDGTNGVDDDRYQNRGKNSVKRRA
jgi:hypothetical protein